MAIHTEQLLTRFPSKGHRCCLTFGQNPVKGMSDCCRRSASGARYSSCTSLTSPVTAHAWQKPGQQPFIMQDICLRTWRLNTLLIKSCRWWRGSPGMIPGPTLHLKYNGYRMSPKGPFCTYTSPFCQQTLPERQPAIYLSIKVSAHACVIDFPGMQDADRGVML